MLSFQIKLGDVKLQIFDLENVHWGMNTSDNSMQLSNICSASIV